MAPCSFEPLTAVDYLLVAYVEWLVSVGKEFGETSLIMCTERFSFSIS